VGAGLAEAGLIPSNLLHSDVGATSSVADYEFDGVVFGPDRYATNFSVSEFSASIVFY
jgi:hypothetical protein